MQFGPSRRSVLFGLFVVAAIVLPAAQTQAAVVHLRELAYANPNLVHQYSFEGTTLPQRQDDNKGTNDLVINAIGTGSGASIAYLAGFDGTTEAMRPHFVNTTNGAALQTTTGVALPGAGFTTELLVAPGATTSTNVGFAFAGPLSPSRGYFLFQREGDLKLAAGSGTFADGAALRDVTSTYSTNNWYYVAVQMRNSGGNTIVNAYVANLTAGQTTLTQTLTNVVITGNYGTTASPFGIGMFPSQDQPFNGLIDEVAYYNSLLSLSTLSAHLDAIYYVPEPSSGLLLLCGMAVVGRRRRAARLQTQRHATC